MSMPHTTSLCLAPAPRQDFPAIRVRSGGRNTRDRLAVPGPAPAYRGFFTQSQSASWNVMPVTPRLTRKSTPFPVSSPRAKS